MQTKLKGKHFISTQDWTVQELETIFELAAQLKREYAAGQCEVVSAPKIGGEMHLPNELYKYLEGK